MSIFSKPTLHAHALKEVAARRGGLIVSPGSETRSQQELVELGHLWQEIASGGRYKFTLSPSGQRILDQAEAMGVV
jgi:hypothetical protein